MIMWNRLYCYISIFLGASILSAKAETILNTQRIGGIVYTGTSRINPNYTTVPYSDFNTSTPYYNIVNKKDTTIMTCRTSTNSYMYSLSTLVMKDTIPARTDVTKVITFKLLASNGAVGPCIDRKTRVEFFDYGTSNPSSLGISYKTSASAGSSSSTYSKAYGAVSGAGIYTVNSNITSTVTYQNNSNDTEMIGTHYYGLLVGGDYANINGTSGLALTLSSAQIIITGVENVYTSNIRFDANGGTGNMEPQTKTGNEDVTLNACTFIKDGFVFTGWNTAPNGNGTSYQDGDIYTEDHGTVLYAQWQKAPYILTDGMQYDGEANVDNVEIIYKRIFKNTLWQAWYVPFDISYRQLADDFEVADITMFRELADGTSKMEGETLDEGILEANHPYLIRAKETGEKEIRLVNATLYAAKSRSSNYYTTNTKYTIVGTYTTVTDMYENDYWAMAGGGLKRAASSTVTLSPFRWYVKTESRGNASAKSISFIHIVLDGNATAINNVSEHYGSHTSIKYIKNGEIIIGNKTEKYKINGIIMDLY